MMCVRPTQAATILVGRTMFVFLEKVTGLMATLFVHNGEGVRAYRVTQNTMIGRDNKCGIFVDEPGVSLHHAVLEFSDAHWTIEDAGSRNGTRQKKSRINGKLRLGERDEFSLGKVRVDFRRADIQCAACHAALENAEAVHNCANCAAMTHATCRKELGVCPVSGCGESSTKEQSLDNRPTTDASDSASTLYPESPDQSEKPAWAVLVLATLPGLVTFGSTIPIAALLVLRGGSRLRPENSGRWELAAMASTLACAVVSYQWWLGDFGRSFFQ